MSNVQYKQLENKEKILNAVDTIAGPVVQTLGPLGNNVLFEDKNGGILLTNDGVTIAKSVEPENPFDEFIVRVIKGSALTTNSQAGDGTTTTILLARSLIKDGLKLLEDGWNPMQLKKELEGFGDALIERLEKNKKTIDNDKQLLSIAKISANNDEDIAKDIVQAAKVTGEDGMVFLEPSQTGETEIIEDTGFNIEAGMLTPDLINDPRTFTTRYTDVPVLITDKRIYYSEEAETILRTAMEAGHDSVVVVARDFIGSSVNVFLANHTKKINILLVKDPHAKENDSTSLDDLATYLGGKVITEKSGSLVNKLKEDDFVIADKVFADGGKTLLTSKEKINPGLQERVKGLKDELKKDPENDRLKKRISSLTNGMVTIKVGANTPLELRERMYRYEDAINATKNAMKFGYLPGGGIALADAFKSADNPQLDSVYKRYCESSLRQLATNCGKHPDSLIENVKALPVGQGYNALTDEYGDMVKFGIIDPFKVTEMAIKSSVSIANAILSAGYLIIDNKEEKE